MNQLKIFVSSTCYDLSQIRFDLFEFISGLGHMPLLSENTTFPINPINDTISNCLDNVAISDIFVLIVGNRYGSIINSDKSITNTEYLYAKERGIPRYIFISKPLIDILPVWRKNKEADFTDTVESNKVFEFIETLRITDKNWCFAFDKAQDITKTLRFQFSHLFQRALIESQKLKRLPRYEFWDTLSTKAVSIILEEKDYHELKFFIQVLEDELIKYEVHKLDWEYEVFFSSKSNIEDVDILIQWINSQLAIAMHFVNSGVNLMENAFPKYYGKPGEPSDIKGLYYVACSLARLFKEMLCWAIDIRSTSVNDEFILLRNSLSNFCTLSANRIWEYPSKVRSDINNGLERLKNGEYGLTINCELAFAVDEGTNSILLKEIRKLRGGN